MSQLIYSMKQAWASLNKKPGFVSTVVVTMGLTLGALLCVLTLAYFLLVEPLPYPEQQKLHVVRHLILDNNKEVNAGSFTYPGLVDLYKRQDAFDTGAILSYDDDVLTSSSSQPLINVTAVTPEWFTMLGAKMVKGRAFEQTEALDTFNPVAIISHDVWMKEFSGNADILGQKVDFSGVSYRIVGVLDESFVEPQISSLENKTHIWVPFDYSQNSNMKESWGSIMGSLFYVGKLKESVSKSQAEQSITPLVNDLWQEKVKGIAFFSGWSIRMELRSFQTVILGDSRNTVLLLLAGVLGLVIIASANIANLFMSRTAEKQRQLAIFAAIGAKKSHLFKTIFAETGLLMGLSVLLALLISTAGFALLQDHLGGVLPRVGELTINVFTLASAVFFAVLFAVLFALLSTKMINYRALNSMLQSSGKGTGVQVSKKIRQVLIVSQVAIASVLVFANISLFKESYQQIVKPLGYDIDDKVLLTLSYAAQSMPAAEEVVPVTKEIRNKITQLPQVEYVSRSGSPIGRYGLWAVTSVADNTKHTPHPKNIDERYFDMVGMTLLEGDNFTAADIEDRNRVLIVNDVFAKRLNPEGSAVGMQIASGGPGPYTVIGVVKGIAMPGEDNIPIRVYRPTFPSTTTMAIQLQPGKKVSREQLASVVKEVDGMYSVFDMEYFTDRLERMLFTQYVTAVTTAVLASITLFLAGIGLYGILSYGTQMRRFELGTRMAIGAKRKHLIAMVVKDNATIIMFGLFAGLLILLGGYIGYSDVLVEYLNVSSIVSYAATLIAIAGLSLFACYWPLRQFINTTVVHSLRGSD